MTKFRLIAFIKLLVAILFFSFIMSSIFVFNNSAGVELLEVIKRTLYTFVLIAGIVSSSCLVAYYLIVFVTGKGLDE